MKFNHEFKRSLKEEGFPQTWVDKAIPYGQLKKCLNKVTAELGELGLDRETLVRMASAPDNPCESEGFQYLLNEDSPDSKHFRPRLTVFVHHQGGYILDASLTPSTRHFLQSVAPAPAHSDNPDSPPLSPASTADSSSLASPTSPSWSLSTTDSSSVQRVEVPLVFDGQFFDILQTDVSNLDSLQRQEQDALQAQVAGLSTEIRALTRPSRARKSKKDTALWREVFELYLDASVFFSTRECDHGSRSSAQALEQLRRFQDQVLQRKLVQRMKLDSSRKAFSCFLNINAVLLQNLKFQEINRLAITKILKKFDKRTALGVSKRFFGTIHSDRLLAEGVAKDICAQVSNELISVVPQLDDYLCPICFAVAYWPLRLDCSHVFCSRCMVKMSRKGEKNCPLCRADVVMKAGMDNFDSERAAFLRKHFPKEVKEKIKANELERNREIFGPDYTEGPGCRVM